MPTTKDTQAAGAATLETAQRLDVLRRFHAAEILRAGSSWPAAVAMHKHLLEQVEALASTAPSAQDSAAPRSLRDALEEVVLCTPTPPVAAPSSLSAEAASEGRDEDDQYTLDRAADLLEHYLAYVKDVKPDDIERHPYIPEMEQVAADLRKFAAIPPAQAPAIQAPETVALTNEMMTLAMNCGAYLTGDVNAGSALVFRPDELAKFIARIATPSAAVSAGPVRTFSGVVEVCPDCDIADCFHIRARRATPAPAPTQHQPVTTQPKGEA